MMTGLERPRGSELVDRLDRLRGQLAGTDAPPGGGPPAIREAIGPIDPEADPAAADALGRLALMAEVWDCLVAEGPEAVSPLPGFFERAIDRLCDGLRLGDPGGASAWILRESESRWGDYLALIDPSIDPAAGGRSEGQPTTPCDPPAIDAAELIRRISGLPASGPPASPAPPPDPRPPAPADDGPAIDAAELTRALTDPAAVGPAPLAPRALDLGPTARDGPTPPPAVDDDPGPAIDAAELLRRLTGSPPSAGPPGGTDPGPPAGEAPWWERALEVPAIQARAKAPAVADPMAEARGLELDPELRAILIADMTDLFGRIQGLVLGLGSGGDAGRLHELGRCYHTLKGAAGSAGLTLLAASIHDLEDLLEEAGGACPDDLVRRMEESLSTIEGTLGALDDREGPDVESPPGDPTSPTASAPPTDDGPGHSEADGLIRMPAARFEELVDLCSELLTRRRAWAGLADRMKGLAHSARGCSHRLRGNVDRLTEAVPTAAIGGRAPRPLDDELTTTLRRMGEQAEDLVALAATAREAALPMAAEAEDLSRLSLRLWEGLQSVRIVPVRSLFQRLIRVARDAARVEGRAVEVVLVGEETGADRALLDKAYEPLLHVVRNAVGHGIEPPDDRERLGKPRAGTITLEARREGNTVVLSVRDDGRGLDHEAILAKGRRVGLIGPDEHPGVDRLNGLIFHPGFSTRSQANSVSGRGVGMDVVAREVELLRGRIELSSTRGRGTGMTIRLPTRISLEPVMVVRIRGQAFAVPTSAIDAVGRADRVDRGGPGARPTVAVGGRELPMLDLGSILGFSGPIGDSCPTVLVVTADSGAVALRVDGIDGPMELVLKPLGPLLAGHPAASGAGLSPAGEVIPALNVAGLLRLAGAGARESTAISAPVPLDERPAALVVDDSLSVRRIASRRLRALGFEVDEANDGEEALGRLRGRSYRLIMTDLEMPRMDGFALLAELGRTGVMDATGVVVTSTLTDEATRRRVLDLGAIAFVPKPVDPGTLALAVSPLLGLGPRPADRPN
ncbi:hybrid sensor histidine kinase/response regulator [Tautonia plasticadhaerens]|uniref:histidine kinase n=1 Tax=Tautonia plasticadhaerens TaxID=2527974 RepID=A0A518H4P8_9BACT|nr:response regulator [Tautonia plasticadhaerens]QDV35812.1 Gliding motility regulatory protein [Tautonia plasticadhaerens]